jgi:DNA-3-methyladenine glycosylase I
MNRCEWAANELMISYHDEEWGVPLHDERLLFEFLILEGAQAGLSWNTILNKRKSYRDAFDDFDVVAVSNYGDDKFQGLMANAGIVRNRLKIASTIGNAKAFMKVAVEAGSFDSYIWGFVGGSTKTNEWPSISDAPATTAESEAMSKDLKKRGFKFVGSTICYAFMQATGMVNDHKMECFRHGQV